MPRYEIADGQGVNVGADDERYDAGDHIPASLVAPWMLEEGIVRELADATPPGSADPLLGDTTDTKGRQPQKRAPKRASDKE